MVNKFALAFALAATLPAAAFAQNQVKVSVEIENLSKEQGDLLRLAVGGNAALGDVAVFTNKISFSVKEEMTFKLSEIEKALAGIKQDPNKKLTILIEKIRLAGKVDITCEGDEVKLQGALAKVTKLKDLHPKGGGCYCCNVEKGGVIVADIVKAITKAGKGDDKESPGKVIDLLWYGPPKAEAKPTPEPGKPTKKPGGG